MGLKRGQVIFHTFKLPGLTESAEHPVLIISNETVCTECDMYVGLMITSSNVYGKDYFTFELKDSMFSRNTLSKDHAYIRLHLVAYFDANSIYKPNIVAEVKSLYIDEILETQRIKVFDDE